MNDDELRAALTSRSEVLGLQILSAAMVGGAALFLLVTGVLHSVITLAPGAAEDVDPSLFAILSGVHAVMFVSGWTLGIGLYRWRTRDLDQADSPRDLWNRVRSAAVIRLALLEGCALFGTVICLLGVVEGAVAERPWIWANAASTVLFIAFAAATFPSGERLVRQHSSRTGW